MFNALLLINGYAKKATYSPDVKYSSYFRKFEKEGRDEGKGIWNIR